MTAGSSDICIDAIYKICKNFDSDLYSKYLQIYDDNIDIID